MEFIRFLGALLAVLIGTFAIAFVIVWFPHGFLVGDLNPNPFAWSQEMRGVLLLLWIAMLVLIALSASC